MALKCDAFWYLLLYSMTFYSADHDPFCWLSGPPVSGVPHLKCHCHIGCVCFLHANDLWIPKRPFSPMAQCTLGCPLPAKLTCHYLLTCLAQSIAHLKKPFLISSKQVGTTPITSMYLCVPDSHDVSVIALAGWGLSFSFFPPFFLPSLLPSFTHIPSPLSPLFSPSLSFLPSLLSSFSPVFLSKGKMIKIQKPFLDNNNTE